MPGHLPHRFCWRPLTSGQVQLNAYGLLVGTVEVARVTRRVDGAGWAVNVNRHLDHEQRASAVYRNLFSALRQVEAWAAANSARLPGGSGGSPGGR